MVQTSVIGYPRFGAKRELKKAVESYFANEITREQLEATARELRARHWQTQQAAHIDWIASGDFSFYDNLLDTAFTFGAIPERYRALQLDELDTYFALARGYQKDGKDVKALPLKKWFTTNYHYVVPEIEAGTTFELNATRLLAQYEEAKQLGIETKPTIIGPFTFIKLAKYSGDFAEVLLQLAPLYKSLVQQLHEAGATVIQIEEPALCYDLTIDEVKAFRAAYERILTTEANVLLQTYFGDIRDVYEDVQKLPFYAIGLDFVEGKHNLDLIQQHGFAADKVLVAGVVNGRNVWRNDYKKTLTTLSATGVERLVIGTAASLLFVPYTVANETKLHDDLREQLSFAEEKLTELRELAALYAGAWTSAESYLHNQALLAKRPTIEGVVNEAVRARVAALTEADFSRSVAIEARRLEQRASLNLPLLPTTTIGSLPQTKEVRQLRAKWRRGEVTTEAYEQQLRDKVVEAIRRQEELDFDILVHGEFERVDMVEHFAQFFSGFIFTEQAWVQSYGTRGLKPPIIFGDVERLAPMTVAWSTFAQSVTDRPVKGMLTGPITILNWSFPREDVSLRDIAYQIGLALRDEVKELEASGIRIIQIDEAALREKLPLRRADWHEHYLTWAVQAFRLTNATVDVTTQIHTHMCYSEFNDIIAEIEALDADVISIEAARSDFSLLQKLRERNFKLEVGPGVYDIHSPRVPTVEELTTFIGRLSEELPVETLWINPDCGLKTRGESETYAALANLVTATKAVREQLTVTK